MIAEGIGPGEEGAGARKPGPYQVQAAIAAVHADTERPEDTDWNEIDQLYAVLQGLQPSPVVSLNRAVAVAKLHGPAAALAMIEPLGEQLPGYFHFYGVKGALLKELGRVEDAREAFERALALCNTAAEADHIKMQIEQLPKPGKASAA